MMSEQIMELSLSEIDEVAGGPLPAIVVVAAKYTAITAAAGVVGAAAWNFAEGFYDGLVGNEKQ